MQTGLATKRTDLSAIVREYLVESGSTTLHKFPRLLQIAISGVREMNMDVDGVPKSVFIPINTDNFTVPLPDDYLTYSKVAFCGKDGNIHSLGYNGNMCLPRHRSDCGDPIRDNTQDLQLSGNNWNTYEGGFYRNGEILGRVFGIGGGNNANGFYRFDDENRFIALQNIPSGATELWLEYLGDQTLVDGDHAVHPYSIEAVKAWMYWKDIQRNRTFGPSEKREAKTEWIRNKNLARRRFSSFTLDEALQAIRRSNTMSVKN